ncbi:YodC family protein [Myxococcus sp. AB025B]|uniref:YodC family protein n=1 Tax=Myxococcus sp. AB025B TaxID=2562794 RepID=UPI001E56529E|nr:YodC family protein [Myxococcus sp. AB025B]
MDNPFEQNRERQYTRELFFSTVYEVRDDMTKGSAKSRFQVGDIVKLKSGGPEMTVTYRDDDGDDGDYYQCQWFAGRKLESGRLPEASLEPASVKPPMPAPGAGGSGA